MLPSKPILRVLEVYGHVTLQGERKDGFRRFGVPPGGAFDQESLKWCTNRYSSVAIEIAMGAIRLVAQEQTLAIVAGAEAPISLDGRGVLNHSQFFVYPGQIIEIGAPTKGARTYLSVHGMETVRLGSFLSAGTVLDGQGNNLSEERVGHLEVNQVRATSTIESRPIRVIPFHENFDGAAMTVSHQIDRVGIRLQGPSFDPGPESLSEPASFGTIQVANDGSLIILGPDGPTIGGYRKLGAVCSADLDLLGQLRPGQSISLVAISREQAISAWNQRVAYLATIHATI